jgi:hypothetical protein
VPPSDLIEQPLGSFALKLLEERACVRCGGRAGDVRGLPFGFSPRTFHSHFLDTLCVCGGCGGSIGTPGVRRASGAVGGVHGAHRTVLEGGQNIVDRGIA